MSNIFGAYRQNGYVLPDLDLAMKKWAKLGVGPFFRLTDLPLASFAYEGSSALPRLDVALANFGDVQIELIQPTDDTRSPYSDFLESHGEGGLHHISMWSRDFDADLARWELRGFTPDCTGQAAGMARFCYFGSSGADETSIEVAEVGGDSILEALSGLIRDAAGSWDGTNPVRDATELFEQPA